MLQPLREPDLGASLSARYAIVASTYNAEYVDGMLLPAERFLRRSGAKEVLVVRVPGAFEIPAVVAKLLSRRKGRPEAVLCLGVILRGETTHARHIAEAVTHALAALQTREAVPLIHEVLLFENKRQAAARCLGLKHNRGLEAAQTAFEMAKLMRRLGK